MSIAARELKAWLVLLLRAFETGKKLGVQQGLIGSFSSI